MGLVFNPRGKRLTFDGADALWDAAGFVRDAHERTFRLFYFTNGAKAWLTAEKYSELGRSRKRTPFAVEPLDANEVPPRDTMIFPCRSFCGDLNAAAERELIAETGCDRIGRKNGACA
jgi:hypothetical protein